MEFANQPHPDEDALELYALGRLDEAASAPIEEHLLLCEECCNKLDEATDFAAVMREATANVAAAGPSPTEIQDPVRDLDRDSFWKRFFNLSWLPVPAPAFAMAMIALVAVVIWRPWTPAAPAEWQSVELRATRGDAAVSGAVEGKALRLSLDASGISASNLSVAIVRADGQKIVTQPGSIADGRVKLEYAGSLSPGNYWVRLYEGTELLREYALPVSAR